MRIRTFVLAFLCWTVVALGALDAQTPPAQTPPAQPPRAPQAPPAQPARVARPPAAATTPTVTIQVTDSSGLPLANVQVTAQGPVSRDGLSAEDGSLRFANMRVGAYRLKFMREGSITLERDITVRTGEAQLVAVSLSAAPPAPKPVEPPPPAPVADKSLGPPAEPKLTPIPTFLDKNFIGREGRKDSALGCTTTGTSTLVQLREALLNQSHEDADVWIYVVAGEGTLRLGTSEQHLQAGTFALIPHTVAHGILPGGRNPLILVTVLSGHRTC